MVHGMVAVNDYSKELSVRICACCVLVHVVKPLVWKKSYALRRKFGSAQVVTTTHLR